MFCIGQIKIRILNKADGCFEIWFLIFNSTNSAKATVILQKILPFILVEIIPNKEDPKRINYLRLLQISVCAMSPITTDNTVVHFKSIIGEYLSCFIEECPNVHWRPKHHWMLHLPGQMLNFGPLRMQTCFRYEGKHNFFKQKKFYNFKNIPLLWNVLKILFGILWGVRGREILFVLLWGVRGRGLRTAMP